MKNLLFAVVAMLLGVTTLSAKEVVIDKSELPKSAQKFISTHFAHNKVRVVTKDGDYEVVFDNGTKVEFNKKGAWVEVETKRNQVVPSSIVPSKIAKNIKSKFPAAKVVKIEKDSSRAIEVELDNDFELMYNNRYEYLRMSK